MSGLLERRPSVERERTEPSVVRFDGGDAGSVFDILAVETARSILVELHREPTVPSELADAVDSSLQNVTYHLDNLEEAGLVEVVDQWYSTKGREMNVYAPSGIPLVVTPGDPDEGNGSTTVERLEIGATRPTAGD